MPIAGLTVLILDEFASIKLWPIHDELITYVEATLMIDACCAKLMTVLKSMGFGFLWTFDAIRKLPQTVKKTAVSSSQFRKMEYIPWASVPKKGVCNKGTAAGKS